MTTCLILAAGNAERHNGGNKPLLKVHGETLLQRTWTKCREKTTDIWLVTHREDLRMPSMFCPTGRRWITETLLSTRDAWRERTVVLLGDVYYTGHAIETMFEDTKWAAFGKGCNIHAMRWNSRYNSHVAAELKKSVDRAEKQPTAYGAGKLWTFISAFDPPMPVIDFGDETTDFDSPQEHQRFIAKYGNRSTHSTGKAD